MISQFLWIMEWAFGKEILFLKGNLFIQFKKMVATKDGEYMFILGEERGYNGGGGLAQYYRSTNSNGTWKYYAGGNGLSDCSKFNEEQINLAKKYATELGLINSCTDSENEIKNISDL